MYLNIKPERKKGIHSYSDHSPALPGHVPHQAQPTSQPILGPSPEWCVIPRDGGVPGAPQLPWSWPGWWDGPWLLGLALTDPRGP